MSKIFQLVTLLKAPCKCFATPIPSEHKKYSKSGTLPNINQLEMTIHERRDILVAVSSSVAGAEQIEN